MVFFYFGDYFKDIRGFLVVLCKVCIIVRYRVGSKYFWKIGCYVFFVFNYKLSLYRLVIFDYAYFLVLFDGCFRYVVFKVFYGWIIIFFWVVLVGV